MDIKPSDNILKLRKLSEKLCEMEYHDDYKDIIFEVKEVLNSSKEELGINRTLKEKIKCYEKMCGTITNLLQKLK